jgi:ACR3 family arsenite transporter
MKRETLERHQVWIYLAAILAGLALGAAAPGLAPLMEALLWPSLTALLYATFTQVPLAHLPAAFRDMRFMTAVLAGNFAVLPLLVGALLALVPDDPAVRLGVLLVLLVPCTDWFITFAHQAGGDVRRAIVATPVVLVVQIVLLPVFLWVLMGDGFAEIVSAGRMATVFLVVIIAPLALAYLTERRVERDPARSALIARLGWLPVPLLALVVLLIAGSQVEAVRGALPLMGDVLAPFLLFLAAAAALGVGLGRLFALPVVQARTLVFSFSTRNSFVVLPFALALPAGWEAAAIVIVFQSLVELFGMLLFLWLVPRLLLPARGPG